ncbi:tyrosyl-tRNA synthetase [Pyrolobus fumarii 1A]|uniref:Tyrosine--tRNA ligase n=1 Tax=Pyrolobus fumarii (strain DSM 11204 / 1A) TaxID=694429 RepID=G0EG28_PYRF1|nr:tyrosine--tRNA ligase [Pyrolobus fumarii]AEM38276.1 tyrosyl-tRNA synthetase [Pyrolobus fumarii 1A]
MDVEKRLKLITRNAVEVVTLDELRSRLEAGEKLRGYIGFEPSGLFHIGWLIWAFKVKDLVEAGVEFTILEATWHAWVNDKLGGNMELIRKAARHVRHVLEAIGVPVGKIKFVDAEELVSDKDYWALFLKVAKSNTLARVKRALTIMGRRVEEGEQDFSKLIYPAMQVTDIFYLGVDIALGGTDQRKAHMLARDTAEKLKLRKPIAIHTPLLTGLQGLGRMNPSEVDEDTHAVEFKMSKSKPETAIFVFDSPEDIARKLRRAYCPPRETRFNPVIEIAKYILFPSRPGYKLVIERPEKFGGGVIEVTSPEELEKLYQEGKIHPLDLKNAVARDLAELLKPVREYFERNEEARETLEELKKVAMKG